MRMADRPTPPAPPPPPSPQPMRPSPMVGETRGLADSTVSAKTKRGQSLS
jgi:hypothetical protein